MTGEERLNYPDNHIEANNRLSWFLDRLDERFGNTPFFVHLRRNDADTAKSYSVRTFPGGILQAYRHGILMNVAGSTSNISVSLDYCHTVNSNISLFLKDKDKKIEVRLETIKEDFKAFWKAIGAKRDIDAALTEFDVQYNKTEHVLHPPETPSQPKPLLLRAASKAKKLIIHFPSYLAKR
jgi:hypothetical protein